MSARSLRLIAAIASLAAFVACVMLWEEVDLAWRMQSTEYVVLCFHHIHMHSDVAGSECWRLDGIQTSRFLQGVRQFSKASKSARMAVSWPVTAILFDAKDACIGAIGLGLARQCQVSLYEMASKHEPVQDDAIASGVRPIRRTIADCNALVAALKIDN